MKLSQGDKYMTANGRPVTIRELHGNFAIGEFENGKFEFWHLDGFHDDDPQLHLKPLDAAALAPAPRRPALKDIFRAMVTNRPGLTIAAAVAAGLLLGVVVFNLTLWLAH